MLGRIYLSRRKPEKAKYYFQNVIQNYPSTRAAYKAKLEIGSLKVMVKE
jgi:TolA-binding protein